MTTDLEQALEEIDRWKRMARKHEDRAKVSHKTLTDLESALTAVLDYVESRRQP